MKHLLSAGILLLISPFVSAGIPFEFDEPVQINYADRGSSTPYLVSNIQGHIVMIWSTSVSGDLYLVSSKSCDFGETWSSPVRVDNGISSVVSSYDFRITVVSDTETAVVWRHFNADSLYCAYSTDFGTTWLEYNSRIDDGSPGAKHAVSIASDGERLVVLWWDKRTGRPTLRSSYSLDRGMTWSSPDVRVDDDDMPFSSKSFLTLHANSDGSFLAAWSDNRVGDNDIWSSRSTDGGLSWSENIRVHADYLGDQFCPAIAEGTSGDVHIVYFHSTGMTSSVLNSVISMDFGQTWTDSTHIINDPPLNYDCGIPRLTGCVDGTLVATWNDVRTGNWLSYVSISENLGAAWSHPNTRLVSDFPGQPNICALSDAGFIVVYQEYSMSDFPYYAIRARRVEPTPTATATGQFPGTNTPIPTGTPTSTPTPADQTATPSLTPEQTATPTTPPSPSPTPLVTGVTITMPAHQYRPGDPCYCTVTVTNADPEPLIDHPLFLILDVYGEYFFAPSFSAAFDSYPGPWLPGATPVDALPEFTWPDTGTSASGIIWYAAITDPAVTRFVGEWDSWEFGWL